ncbi:translocation/assembly module TamB domain-containing protein [Anaeromyxobacter diazotrophicus]|uniref:translocation/assembly module TamB domain-containing protein n=1 Tax=Anaeromyxobacter diazotrophicus TaxID=2590199 RepID=UPI001F178982|nr:translocation/assembly module TamB [Anaeromyxobacter diazotrophicus]
MKRKVALAFVSAVLALVGAGLLLVRTRWAGDELCRLAVARAGQVTGLRVRAAGCRVDPFSLSVSARDLALGPESAPLFTAEAVRVRLSPVQALGGKLSLAEVRVTRPRLVAVVPPTPAGRAPVCPPPALRQVEVKRLEVEEGALDLTWPGGARVVAGRFDVRSGPVTRRSRLAALARPGVPRAELEVSASGVRVEAGGRRVEVTEARAAAQLALDLSHLELHVATAELPGASVALAGAVDDLCRPRFDLAAAGEGELGALLALAGHPLPVQGRLAVDAALTGRADQPRVAGEVRLRGAVLDGWGAGDATAAVRYDGRELHVDRLELPTRGGRLVAHGVLRPGAKLGLVAEAQVEGVELGELLGRLQLPGAWVMGRLQGKVRVSGTAAPLQLAGEVGLEVADFRVLDHSWERWRPGEATFLDVPRARLDGEVRVDRDGVHLAAGQLRAARGQAAVHADFHFDDARGFSVATQGGVDLSALRHLGPVPVGGLARLERAVVRAAPYGNPHAEAHAAVQSLRFLDLDLGDAAADLSYDGFVLSVAGVEGRRGATRYHAATTVDLGADPVRVRDGRLAATGRWRDLFEAVMPWLPAAVHARDALDGEVSVRATAHGPAAALDAEFQAELGPGELGGRAYDRGQLSGRVEAGAAAVLERAALGRGDGVVRGSGRVAFAPPFAWDLRARAEGLPLAALKLPGEGWQGRLDATGTVQGSWESPRVEASGRARDAAVAQVPVGAVDLGAHLDGAALALSARGEGVRVEVTGRTDGAQAFHARAEVDLADALRFAPGGPPAGLHARVRGAGAADGVLGEPAAARGELRLDEVRAGYGDFQVAGTGPAVVAFDRGRVSLRPLTLRGANTELTVEGTRAADGALAAGARGEVDLRLLAGLLPGVTEPRGRLELAARASGTLADPLLVGTGQLRDAGFRFKELPIALSGLAGDLAFSQNRMLFDGLTAAVNGGRAELSGEVELVRLFPARVRVTADVDEASVRVPEWLPAVVSGRLEAAGTWEDMLLSGKLHVLRARYTEPVELERRLVEVQRRRPPPRPVDRAGAWLRLDLAMAVDGDARVENDLVRGLVRGELTVTGTAAAPGVVGTLTMEEGSRATFRGNEFILTHAVVDFTDRSRLRMSFDAHGEAQVRDYQVFMHLTGPYEDPTVQLTSQPALSQQDLVTLLSLGYTARDTAAAGGVSGVATAAAAQALMSASGLDDQVKRFMPRGGPLRDFAVRITSAYSEGSGQVEPRAEFESKVVDDRFRLRYQAPLGGARGQRAQAEMRLSSHTSIQYQWDNDTPGVSAAGDHGLDLKLRWEWND